MSLLAHQSNLYRIHLYCNGYARFAPTDTILAKIGKGTLHVTIYAQWVAAAIVVGGITTCVLIMAKS